MTLLASLLKQRANDLKMKITNKIDEIKKYKLSSEECKKSILNTQEQQLKFIDEEFDRIVARIMLKKESLKDSYQDQCQDEIKLLEKEISKVDGSINDLNKNIEEVDKYITKLGT